jgi:hypothetical protein
VQRRDVTGGLLDDEVLEPLRIQAWMQVCLRERENPDAGKLGQRLFVGKDVVPELLEAAANTPEQRLTGVERPGSVR